ncbi:MAG: M1 family metallopeptidase [Polyangiales bacterium]
MRPLHLAALLALVACAAPPTVAEPVRTAPMPPPERLVPAPLEPEPVGMLPEGITPTRYTLTLDVDPAAGTFRGEVTIDVVSEAARDAVWLHGQELEVTAAEVRYVGFTPIPARWVPGRRDGVAALHFERPVPRGPLSLHLTFNGRLNRHLEGLYRVEDRGDAYAFTQFEALSARRAFPCFDEPRFKTPFDLTVVTARDHQAVTNTAETAVDDRADGRRAHRFATTEALPTYLLAFAVGPLEVVEAEPLPPNAVRPHPIPLRGVAARGKGQFLRRALADAAPVVAMMERYFDRAYPYPKLDLIAVPDFGPGAMENAGAITFREPLLLVRPDAPVDQMRGVDSVLAHELAHHWFGNLVTLRWWDDIWLNESFATWMAAKATEEVFPAHHAAAAQIASTHGAMGADALSTAVPIRRPIAADDDLRGGSSAIVYAKGAGVLRMVERWMGEEAFRDGIRAYLRAHQHGTAVSADLFRSLTERSPDRPLDALLRTFIETPGVPELAVDLACDANARRVTVTQRRFSLPAGAHHAGGPWAVPVCVRYPDGAQTAVSCGLVTEAQGEVSLGAGACPAWVMPNADAGGYYRWSLPPARLAALVASGWGALTPAERLSTVNNARAAFTAGTMDFAAVRPLLARAAADPERLVTVDALGLWTRVLEEELTGPAAARARREVTALHARAWAPLGWARQADEPVERSLLRRDLAAFLGLTANDPAVRAAGARVGARWLAAPDGGGVPAELSGASLAMLLRGADGATVDRVIARAVASDDALVRFRLLGALGHATGPLLTTKVLPLMADARLRVSEVFSPFGAAMERSATRDAAFGWLESNADAVFARVSVNGRSGTPWLGARFCTREGRERVRAFFTPRLADVPGAEAQLQGALEAIAVCAAERDAQAAGLARAFGAAPAR